MKISTEENEEAVAHAYQRAMPALHAGKPISVELRAIYDVEHMMQEVNSGASFEQYFRWASIEELQNIIHHLEGVGLADVAEIATEAMRVAFPRGIPTTLAEKEDAANWSESQEASLVELFAKLEERNGRVMNVLGVYAKRVGA